jgi:hypothetical protein
MKPGNKQLRLPKAEKNLSRAGFKLKVVFYFVKIIKI